MSLEGDLRGLLLPAPEVTYCPCTSPALRPGPHLPFLWAQPWVSMGSFPENSLCHMGLCWSARHTHCRGSYQNPLPCWAPMGPLLLGDRSGPAGGRKSQVQGSRPSPVSTGSWRLLCGPEQRSPRDMVSLRVSSNCGGYLLYSLCNLYSSVRGTPGPFSITLGTQTAPA